MSMTEMPSAISNLVSDLRELLVVYGYMMQNAPTEEARRIAELNRMTVENSLRELGALYMEVVGEALTPAEAAAQVPMFTNFMDATRYAFMKETQVIRRVSELYVMADDCYRDRVHMMLTAHELNAMRDLYLMT